MQFKINISDLDFIINMITESSLTNKLTLAKTYGEYLAKERYSTGKYIIDLSADEVDYIVEILSDFMMSSGIAPNGEINEIGMRIESIIDIFM